MNVGSMWLQAMLNSAVVLFAAENPAPQTGPSAMSVILGVLIVLAILALCSGFVFVLVRLIYYLAKREISRRRAVALSIGLVMAVPVALPLIDSMDSWDTLFLAVVILIPLCILTWIVRRVAGISRGRAFRHSLTGLCVVLMVAATVLFLGGDEWLRLAALGCNAILLCLIGCVQAFGVYAAGEVRN